MQDYRLGKGLTLLLMTRIFGILLFFLAALALTQGWIVSPWQIPVGILAFVILLILFRKVEPNTATEWGRNLAISDSDAQNSKT